MAPQSSAPNRMSAIAFVMRLRTLERGSDGAAARRVLLIVERLARLALRAVLSRLLACLLRLALRRVRALLGDALCLLMLALLPAPLAPRHVTGRLLRAAQKLVEPSHRLLLRLLCVEYRTYAPITPEELI